MKTINIPVFFLILAIFTFSCGPKQSTKEEVDSIDSSATETITPVVNITLTPLTDSPEFPDASLEMNAPGEDAQLEPGSNSFSYNVKNYELGAQTSDTEDKGLANSGKGQHIHVILNNQPYYAHYEPEFDRELEAGHHVILSFLSRSYHESVKSYGASVLRQFTVGDVTAEPVDLTAPHLFYSRPKGEYKGKDTEHVLLDFYLINTKISEGGNTVRATINGQEFMINKWEPQVMKGLPMGENTIKLELLDKDGNGIPGPFNVVERTVTLSPGDA
ncbi:MAG: phosphopeptide-binding protein [Cyclobacteriaceae bacterium]